MTTTWLKWHTQSLTHEVVTRFQRGRDNNQMIQRGLHKVSS